MVERIGVGSDMLVTDGHTGVDPTVAFDLNGIVYFSYLYQDSLKLHIRKSTDGINWSNPVEIPNVGAPDKDHMVIDTNPNSPYKNYVYIAWTDISQSVPSRSGIPPEYPYPKPIMFSNSTDGGNSFQTEPINISYGTGLFQSHGVNLATGPNGEVYAVWAIYDTWPTEDGIGFNKSTNGGYIWGIADSISNLNVQGIREKPFKVTP